MRAWTSRGVVFVGGLLSATLGAPTPAAGYAIEVHKDFYDHAFAGRHAGRSVTPPSAADLVAFRRFVYELAAEDPAFEERWPTPESFDAAAFKELLALNPGKTVVGIDVVPADRPCDVRTVVRMGSVDPDLDHRNQDRFFLEGEEVALGPYGRAVPYDPRTVWFGGLTGTPSQFDAHGATLRTGDKGSGVLTAVLHPEQFARPPVSLGSAPEFSQSYTDLAMLARLWGGPGSEWLALTFGGNNLHGLEDLGNQIHTTVIGTAQFFVDAKLTFYKEKMRRFFKERGPSAAEQGFVAPERLTTAQVNAAMAKIKAGDADDVDPKVRFALGKEPTGAPTDTEIGIRIIGNHHRLLEDYVQGQYLAAMEDLEAGRQSDVRPRVLDVIERAREGDADFEARCREALAEAGLGEAEAGTTAFAKVLGRVMVRHSAPEAAPIYCAIRDVSKKELQRTGTYDAKLGHDPLDYVEETDGESIERIWELTGRAFARVTTIIRLWNETFEHQTADVAPGSPEARARAEGVAERLVAARLSYLDAAAERREDYLEKTRAEWEEEHGDDGEGFIERLEGLFR